MEHFWNPYLLLFLGLTMIFIEFFVPGGVLGAAGGVVLLLSIIAFWSAGYSPLATLVYFFVVITLLITLIRFALWRINRTGSKNSILLRDDQSGYVASTYDLEMVGKEGVCGTDLKPAGKILIEGVEYQAVSEMGYIKKGTEILVLRGEGAHLIVKEKS